MHDDIFEKLHVHMFTCMEIYSGVWSRTGRPGKISGHVRLLFYIFSEQTENLCFKNNSTMNRT